MNRRDGGGVHGPCYCKRRPRSVRFKVTGATVDLVSTDGWLCVHCGRGRLKAGACSSCGVDAAALARIPRRLGRLFRRGRAA